MKAMLNKHPAMLLLYFLAVLLVTMFAAHPIFLLESFFGAVFFLLMLEGWRPTLKSLLLALPLIILIGFTNPLFSQEGQIILLSVFGKVVTLEAILYGFGIGAMLLGVMLWSRCFSLVMTSDKFLYLFGRFVPGIALVLSMAMRFIPLLKTRFIKVTDSQKIMGLYSGTKSKVKLEGALSAFSSVLTWSLENAVDSGDAMKARGYGLAGRSSFLNFRFAAKDFAFALLTFAFALPVILAMLMGFTKFDYYGGGLWPLLTGPSILAFFAFGLLCFLPFLCEIKETVKWKYSVSKI